VRVRDSASGPSPAGADAISCRSSRTEGSSDLRAGQRQPLIDRSPSRIGTSRGQVADAHPFHPCLLVIGVQHEGGGTRRQLHTQTATAVLGSRGSASPTWLRELMPSSLKTVILDGRPLMNSRATVTGEPREHVVPRAQLLARFQPPALAPQPLAVQQVRTCGARGAGGCGPAGRPPPGTAGRRRHPRSTAPARLDPRAQSVPLGRVVPERRWSASAARRARRCGWPPRSAPPGPCCGWRCGVHPVTNR
jgi:hypothetical protein